MEGGSGMAEAERWLTIAAKLLAARDLYGARTFASRARESDPSYEGSSQILAIADTLLAGDSFVSHHQDWYAVLQLARITPDQDLIATQYRKLLHLLDPAQNKLAFADQALKLVNNAWSVLSDPVKKSLYDNELQLIQNGQLDQLSASQPQTQNEPQIQTPNQQRQPQTPNQLQQPQMPVRRSLRNKGGTAAAEEGPIQAESAQPALKITATEAKIRPKRHVSSRKRPIRVAEPVPEGPIPAESSPTIPSTAEIRPKRSASSGRRPIPAAEPEPEQEETSFWTACPYCYVLFEYPKEYEECALRCQNCRRAFHGAVISPPPATDGQDSYFCTWGFFPIGYSCDPKATGPGGSSNCSPAPAMFASPAPASMNFQPEKTAVGRSRKSAYPYPGHQDDVFIEFSDLSDDPGGEIEEDDDDYEWGQGGWIEEDDDDYDDYDDWERGNERKKAKKVKGKGLVGRPPKRAHAQIGRRSTRTINKAQAQIERRSTRTSNNVGGRSADLYIPSVPQEGKIVASANLYSPSIIVPQDGKIVVVHALLADANQNLVAIRGKKKVAKDLGKLDLNVEFNNDVEEPTRGSEENGAGNDNMEGIGFFEGLDEFLSSLPILSVAGDDKVKAS